MQLAGMRGELFLDDACTCPGSFTDIVRILLLFWAVEKCYEIAGSRFSR
jgi:hypothetical protein